ncbi:MAG: rod shape-determining protein MreC [Verrucomicrobiota bacterium]
MAKRFDQARPFITLGVVAIIWIAIPVAVKTFVRASFFELTAPVPVAESYLRDLQAYWSLRMHSNNDLIEAGRDLARVNASYSLSVQQNSALQAENARLEHILNIPPRPDFRYETARVVERDFSAWWQRITIRKGNDAGITVGSPVVWTEGVVGRVTEVHSYTSVVELISSPGVRIAGLIEGSPQPVSYQGGTNPTFSRPQGTVEFVPLQIIAEPSTPKRLVTSGLGGVFPPGLSLGQVIRVEPSTDGLFKTGEVELDSRLSELSEVTVLVPLKPEVLP